MLDDATVKRLERDWEDGWKAYDLETIVAPYGDDIVFTSPFVSRLTGDPEQTTITGYEAMRTYVAESLRRVPGMSITLDSTYVGTDSVILMHTIRLPDGTQVSGADFMRVDEDGKVVDYRSHFTISPEQVEHAIQD
jgi:hypothetical protein